MEFSIVNSTKILFRDFLTVVLLGVFLVFGDWPIKYVNWHTLTRNQVIEGAGQYVEQHFAVGSACVYVVNGDSGRARLTQVKDFSTWNIEATKELTWRRRFEDFCPGANNKYWAAGAACQ